MRPPPFHLRGLAECVGAVALACAATRWVLTPGTMWIVPDPTYFDHVSVAFDTSVTVFLVCGLIGLIVEAIRGRRPAVSGLGRWTWAMGGGLVLAYWASQLASRYRLRAIVLRLAPDPGRHDWSIWNDMQRRWPASMRVDGMVPMGLLALWLIFPLVRRAEGSTADAREWLGRGMGLLIFVRMGLDFARAAFG